LALALILAGARIRPPSVSEHLVVLLDDSASMSAVDARGESARDRAVRRVLAEIERLGSNARVTLVLSGERPSVFVGPAALRLKRALCWRILRNGSRKLRITRSRSDYGLRANLPERPVG
jgi:hypothetical protein